jgi:hypothetical protein
MMPEIESGPAGLNLDMLLSRVGNWGIKPSKTRNPGMFTGECCGAIRNVDHCPRSL